jgi:hypothetical protein
MRTSAISLTAALLLTSLTAVDTGCKKSPPAPQTQNQPQGVRNSDGSITNPDGSVTYPPGTLPPGGSGQATGPNQVANGPNGPVTQTGTPPMSRPTEAATPAPIVEAPPAPVRVTVPVGTAVEVRLNGGLAASRNDVGDRFSGVLERALVYHGQTVFERGTPVAGEVVASKGKGRFKGAGDLGIEVTAIGRDSVRTSEYEKVGKGRGKRTGGFIAGGGGLGALIGGLAGGGKGALIGGLAGAGAGTAAGAYSGNRDVVIPSESVITFRLRAPLTR